MVRKGREPWVIAKQIALGDKQTSRDLQCCARVNKRNKLRRLKWTNATLNYALFVNEKIITFLRIVITVNDLPWQFANSRQSGVCVAVNGKTNFKAVSNSLVGLHDSQAGTAELPSQSSPGSDKRNSIARKKATNGIDCSGIS
jgi:hypothetical protein